MTRVLAIGECLVEVAPRGDGAHTLGFAGDTFNTCWYLRQIAGEALDLRYFTAVGDDDISRQMLAFMRTAGIEPIAQIDPTRSVGLYLITLDAGERSFSYWRSASAARHMADTLDRLPDLAPGDLVYLSGITLAVLTPQGRKQLLTALDAARQQGAHVAFDPNLRPALWPDAETMRRTITEGAARADIVLPSFDDELRHFGDATPAATATRYGAKGALVVVKNGAEAVTLNQNGVLTTPVSPPGVDVVDTTAAGDSFNAGFLAAYLNGTDAAQACQMGCAVAARVIGGRGALVPL